MKDDVEATSGESSSKTKTNAITGPGDKRIWAVPVVVTRYSGPASINKKKVAEFDHEKKGYEAYEAAKKYHKHGKQRVAIHNAVYKLRCC